MEIKAIDSQPAQPGSEQFFTGRVQVQPLFSADAPARMSCGCVTFDPSARSAWHTHPLGQTLIVTSGPWLGTKLGRSDPRNQARRRDLDGGG
jgi:quercetin dioxygenase-like cupin family protein